MSRPGLDRQDWFAAGQSLLREEGPGALRLSALTARLGVTTGSFYHHFDDVGAYRRELARSWGGEELDAAFATVAALPPAQRVRALLATTVERDMGSLYRAMRSWAATDEHAAAAVRRTDEAFLGRLAATLEELGHDRTAAEARALALFATGIAEVATPWPLRPAHAGRLLDALLSTG